MTKKQFHYKKFTAKAKNKFEITKLQFFIVLITTEYHSFLDLKMQQPRKTYIMRKT